MATIDSYYFRVCVKGAERKGLSADALYARAGIDPAHVRKVGTRDTVEKMADLVRDICVTLDDEFMGYTETPVRHGAISIMADYAYHADTVGKAIARGMKFYGVVSQDIITTLTRESENTLTLEARFAKPELDPDHYFLEFWLIIWHRMACWLAGETIQLKSADFSYPRPDDYFEEFKHLFPCPLTFDSDGCRLRMSARDLDAPVRRSRTELKEMLRRAPLDLMTIPASDHSMARKVYVALRPWSDGRFEALAAEEVAERLGISSVAMRRALRAEGTSFRAVCEDIRRDLACAKLRDPLASVESIANDLGYVETRSFTRAFRAWTGCSPTEFRLQKNR